MSDAQIWRFFTISGVTLLVSLFLAIVWPSTVFILVADAALLSLVFFLGRYIQTRKEIKKPRTVGEFEAKTL